MEEAMIDIWAKYEGKPNVRLMAAGVERFNRNLGRLTKVMLQEREKLRISKQKSLESGVDAA